MLDVAAVLDPPLLNEPSLVGLGSQTLRGSKISLGMTLLRSGISNNISESFLLTFLYSRRSRREVF